MELNYPEHAHPHGVAGTKPNKYRIWVCEECNHVFTDNEVRCNLEECGHICKELCEDGYTCESHLEPYIPELVNNNTETEK